MAMNDAGMVYIVDDDASIRALVEAIVRGAGLESRSFSCAEELEGVKIGEGTAGSCILLDLEMPGTSGLEFLEKRFAGELPCSVIILTGHGSVERAVKSMKLGAVDFLQKPFDHKELLRRVTEAVERDRVRRAAEGMRAEVKKRLANLSPREKEFAGGGGGGEVDEDDRGRAEDFGQDGGSSSGEPHGEDEGGERGGFGADGDGGGGGGVTTKTRRHQEGNGGGSGFLRGFSGVFGKT